MFPLLRLVPSSVRLLLWLLVVLQQHRFYFRRRYAFVLRSKLTGPDGDGFDKYRFTGHSSSHDDDSRNFHRLLPT